MALIGFNYAVPQISFFAAWTNEAHLTIEGSKYDVTWRFATVVRFQRSSRTLGLFESTMKMLPQAVKHCEAQNCDGRGKLYDWGLLLAVDMEYLIFQTWFGATK